jgi:hypothetical protein
MCHIHLHKIRDTIIYEKLNRKRLSASYPLVKKYSRSMRNDREIGAVYRYKNEPKKQSQVDSGVFGHVEIYGKIR